MNFKIAANEITLPHNVQPGNSSGKAVHPRHAEALEALESRMMFSGGVGAIALATPELLQAIATTPNSIALTWVPQDTLGTGFAVLRSTDNVHFSSIGTASGGRTTAFVDKSAVSGTDYTYEVEETNGQNVSAASSAVAVTTPLATPISLRAIGTSPTTVQLTWTNKDPQTTGYVVYRSTDGVNFTNIATTQNPSFIDATVSSATAYTYKVEAVNASNQSVLSASATLTTPLAAPLTLTAATSAAGVQLNWAENDVDAAGFIVLRSANGGAYTQIATINDPTVTNYLDTAVNSSQTYRYEVRAFSGAVMSGNSNAVAGTMPPLVPSALTAGINSATSVQLNWTDNDPGATGYFVLRSTDGINFTSIAPPQRRCNSELHRFPSRPRPPTTPTKSRPSPATRSPRRRTRRRSPPCWRHRSPCVPSAPAPPRSN